MSGQFREELYSQIRPISLIICALIAFFCIASAILIEGNWSFGKYSFSQLGISSDPLIAGLFNYGCIVAGFLMAGLRIITIRKEKTIDMLINASMVLAGIFLGCVGIITLNMGAVHDVVSSLFALFFMISLILTIIKSYQEKNKFQLWVTAATCLLSLILMLVFIVDFNKVQFILVSAAIIWMLIMGVYECKWLMDIYYRIMDKYREPVMYVIMGGFTTIVTWVTYALFVFLGIEINASNILSWVCGVIFAFVTNKWLVFEAKSLNLKVIAKELVSFTGARIFTGIIAWVLFPILIELGLNQVIFGVEGLASKIVTSIIEIILNWIFSKYLVFTKKEKKDQKQ